MAIKKLDWKKISISTIALWLLGTVFAMLTCGGLFNWVYTLPPNIWVDAATLMSAESMIVSNIWGIIRSLIFVVVYVLLFKGLPGKGIMKGVYYGLIVWLVGAFAGMATMPLYMTINVTVVVYWIAQALVLNLMNGVIVAAIFKKGIS